MIDWDPEADLKIGPCRSGCQLPSAFTTGDERVRKETR